MLTERVWFVLYTISYDSKLTMSLGVSVRLGFFGSVFLLLLLCPSFSTSFPTSETTKTPFCCARPTLPRRSSTRRPSFPKWAAREAMYGQREDWDASGDEGGPTLPPPGRQKRGDRAVRSTTRQVDQPEPVAHEPVPVQQAKTPRAVKTRSISKANPLQRQT